MLRQGPALAAGPLSRWPASQFMDLSQPSPPYSVGSRTATGLETLDLDLSPMAPRVSTSPPLHSPPGSAHSLTPVERCVLINRCVLCDPQAFSGAWGFTADPMGPPRGFRLSRQLHQNNTFGTRTEPELREYVSDQPRLVDGHQSMSPRRTGLVSVSCKSNARFFFSGGWWCTMDGMLA